MSTLLTVTNHHCEGCGLPPEIAHTVVDGRYVSYFENTFGEQFLLVIDRRTRRGWLYAGDLGWDSPVEIEDSRFVSPLPILSAGERGWLSACMAEAFGPVVRTSAAQSASASGVA